MKKMIAMLLVVILCLGLVACGGSDEPAALSEMSLVGTWDNDGNKMIFNDDHTGTVSQASTGMKFQATWTFDADECTWTISYADTYSTTVTITESDGTYVMDWNGTMYTLETE